MIPPAAANMVTNGESKASKPICVMGCGSVGFPCGVCRELLMQLDKDSSETEILTDFSALTADTLERLAPNWWGKER